MYYRGIGYPVKSGVKGLFDAKTDLDLIKGNIKQIIGTRRGERVMLPLFGSRIPDFIFEPLDYVTCALLRFELIQAVQRWEPRIILNRKRTVITPYPSEFRVKAILHFYMKTYRQNQDIILEISRKDGVNDWLD
ncbi:MAG: GPW/gp25 family protein [Synergistaceae bacterium]|nr:GPW/gp25 family protein [Synergistaceae bacterium]MBR0093818.1 GPW/gp25 family protein [Synergistaceae bacterium]